MIEEYRGGDIALGIGEEFISPVYYSFMQKLVGQTLIVTDGTTLLGADNKAGIAEIMTALSILQKRIFPIAIFVLLLRLMKKLVWESIISQWKSFPVIGHIPLMGRSRGIRIRKL